MTTTTRNRRPIHTLIAATCLLLVWPLAATLAAQEPEAAESEGPARDRWFLAVGGGLLQTGDSPSGSFTFDHGLFGSEQGTFDADYAGGNASLYELSIGMRLRGRLALGLTWSESSLSEEAEIAGQVPHPFLFGASRTVEGTARGLSRDETAVHLSLRWLIRDGDRFQFALFGGPTQIDLDYELATAVQFDQTYPFDTATYAGVERVAESADAIGFHAGVDLARYFNDTVGVGGVLRYSSASIDLDAPDGGSIQVDGGGLQIVVDLRFRF